MARLGLSVKSPRLRLVAIIVLVGVLTGLLVWYGSLPPDPAAGEYPGSDELTRDYAQYHGDRVVVSGPVLSTDPVVIDAVKGPVTYRLTITGVDTPVSRGEHLSVYGVVLEDRTIQAITAYAVPQSGLWYAYVTSFVAGLWVLGRLLSHWRLDRDPLGLTPRETPLDGRTIVREWRSQPTGDTDA